LYPIPIKISLTFSLLIPLILLRTCDKQYDADTFYEESDQYEILIIPPHPGNQDTILLIEKICSINPEASLKISGNQIYCVRYFNTLMGAPCLPEPDTSEIGLLAAGTYEVIHIVIDRNPFLSDSIFLQDTVFFKIK